MRYARNNLHTDVLIIGGGISGCLAAIHAAKEGASCMVLEKSNTKRSGNAGSGIDHLFSYIPPLHHKVGYTMEEMKKDQNQMELCDLGLGFPELNDFFVEHSYERILELEKYGLKFRFEDSRLPGGFRVVSQFHSVPASLNFEGRDVKRILTEEVKKAGAQIYNRVFVTELIKNGNSVCGAIGIGTRENVIYVVNAKTTILATAGGVDRLCRSATGADFERFHAPSINNGAGKVLAMQAGADVVNLEYIFSRGSAEWLNWTMGAGAPGGTYWPCGRIVDEHGNVVVGRNTAFDVEDPEYKKKHQEQFEAYCKERGSMKGRLASGEELYLDFEDASDEEIEYVKWSLGHEGKCNTILRNMEAEGTRFQDVRIPYQYTDLVQTACTCSGVYTNVRCETTVENLYAAGNEMGGVSNNSAPEAVVFGIEAGIQAAKKAKEMAVAANVDEKQVERIQKLVETFRTRETGDAWLDVEHAIQNIVSTFGTLPHTDKKCEDALKALNHLEESVHLKADSPHETGRCLDVLFILETAKAAFMACRNRRTSLGPFMKELGEGQEIHPSEKAEIYGIYKENGQYRFHIINQSPTPKSVFS